MSIYKDGEGSWIIDVDPFTCTAINAGGQYEIIVLAGGAVVDRSPASVGGIRNMADDKDYHLQTLDGLTVSLVSRSKIFLTHYPQNEDFDVIIKEQATGKTIKMLPNVGFRHG